eukprot:9599832-Lingulodinium_polyedra.AAC.1
MAAPSRCSVVPVRQLPWWGRGRRTSAPDGWLRPPSRQRTGTVVGPILGQRGGMSPPSLSAVRSDHHTLARSGKPCPPPLASSARLH